MSKPKLCVFQTLVFQPGDGEERALVRPEEEADVKSETASRALDDSEADETLPAEVLRRLKALCFPVWEAEEE